MNLLEILIFNKLKNKKGGITPTGTINITENGEIDVTNYATANVNVPQPTGAINITENGETNVTDYATANVNVPLGYRPYKQLTYIESSGTQYIDLGILPRQNLAVKLDYQFLEDWHYESDVLVSAVGCGEYTGTTRFAISQRDGNGKFEIGMGAKYPSSIAGDFNRHTFLMDMYNKKVGVDNERINWTEVLIDTPSTFTLFARHLTNTGGYGNYPYRRSL